MSLAEGKYLVDSGFSIRESARRCRVHHETLRRYLKKRKKLENDEKVITTSKKIAEELCNNIVWRIRNPLEAERERGKKYNWVNSLRR